MLDFGRVKFKIKGFVFIAIIFALVFTCKFTYAEEKETVIVEATKETEVIEETKEKEEGEDKEEKDNKEDKEETAVIKKSTSSEIDETEVEEELEETLEEEPEEDAVIETESEDKEDNEDKENKEESSKESETIDDEEKYDIATISEIEEVEEVIEETKDKNDDETVATASEVEETEKKDEKKLEVKKEDKKSFSDTATPRMIDVSIYKAPNKTSYKVSDRLDMSGLVLLVEFDNGTSVNVVYNSGNAMQFIFEPSLSTALTTNDAFVTVTYGGYSVSIPISVVNKATPIPSRNSGNNSSSGNGGGGGARMGRVIAKDEQKTLAQMNEDAMNQFLLSILAASMTNNQFGFMQLLPFNMPTQNVGVPYTSPARPTAITNYINNNPLLTYTVNVDGSYTFANGMTVFPSGIMMDSEGNTYFTDGSSVTSNGLTQFANGSVRDASGVVYNVDGTINLPNNSYIDTNGITHYSDGSVKLTDGTIYNIDGSIDFPNGTVLTKSGRVIKRTKKAVETEEKEKNRAAWRYDPVSNEWHVELGDRASTYYK